MDTEPYTNDRLPVNRADLDAQIALWRGNLVDLDIVVDDKRQVADRDLEDVRKAVHERDRAAAHLARLIEWREHVDE